MEIEAQAIFMIKDGFNGIYNNELINNKNPKLIKKICFQELIDRTINIKYLTALTLLIKNDKY